MRYPLIDFHGNCGSRDGDGPAAYRYTECRLSPIAEATLADINKDTVDWQPTYAETEEEPVYLPGRFPNLLCNGTMGIAIAMACSFAPHNLNDVIDAAIYYLNNNDATSEQLYNYIKGPDFPTGGTIINANELKEAYITGKGKARIRGEYIVERAKNHDLLVFTSIPYKVSKEILTQEIDQLCETKELEGIAEIRDESNKQGVRFVIELMKDVNADVIANKLYRLTDLESTYSINQVALSNKVPKLMTLRDLIKEYVKHQEEVFKRRTQFDLSKLEKRIHILEGLIKACIEIDKIIQTIKKSENTSTAKQALITEYSFSEAQAQAILDMKLSKLAKIEKISLEQELEEKKEVAEKLLAILNDSEIALNTLCKELEDFKAKFGDARRTTITQLNITPEEKEIIEIVPEECVVIATANGNIKRIPASNFKTQKRNGVGVKAQIETTQTIVKTNTVDTLMVFTSFGKVYRISVNDIPVGTNTSRGTSIETLLSLDKNEKYVTLASIEYGAKEGQYVWFVTKNGLIKKTALNEYIGTKRKTGIVATGLKAGDEIASIFISPDSHIMIFTSQGMSLRLNGKDIGTSSRTSLGVKGITLKEEDQVITAFACGSCKEVLIALNGGTIKRVSLNEFVVQNRAGKGLMCAKDCTIVDAIAINETDNILVAGNLSNICITAKDIALTSRTSMGVKAIKAGNIISISKV